MNMFIQVLPQLGLMYFKLSGLAQHVLASHYGQRDPATPTSQMRAMQARRPICR